MPRAFWDAMQFWGVSTVLFETGTYTGEDPIFLEKLNFVALLSVFDALANNSLDKIDYTLYDKIPLEGKEVFDLLIRDALIINGLNSKPFKGDVGININYKLKNKKIESIGYIKDIGDLDIYTGKEIMDAQNYILTPDFLGLENISAGSNTYKNLNGEFRFDQITEICKKNVENNKLSNKGYIQRDKVADILLFENTGNEIVVTEKIKFVVINGEIKKAQK